VTVFAAPSNLPAPATPLSGRSAELAALTALLEESRLVTVVGAPGVGKSRLALEVASCADGAVSYVALAEVTEAADAVASIEAVMARVARDDTLLVLVDNLEHVASSVADHLERAVQQHPRMRLLCTSRTPLARPAERVYTLGPLAPEEAVDLFAERAARSGAELAGADDVVVQVCDRLDRLPLALEIAATWVRGIGLVGVLDRLEWAVSSDSVMTETVASSLDSLGAAEQELFAALSVFVGEFDLEAVEQVAGRDSAAGMASLVKHSLVQTRTCPGDGRLRYRLLEPLRQQAAARIDDNPVSDVELRRRHARHFATVAERGARALRGPAYASVLADLVRDEGNLLAATAWTRTHDPERCLLLTTDLAGYWEHRGRVTDARARLARALEASPGSDAGRRAEASRQLGRLAFRERDYVAARAALKNAEAIMGDLGDEHGRAKTLHIQALVEAADGEPGRARSLCAESIAIFRRRGDTVSEAWSWTVLALAAYALGDFEELEATLQKALDLAEPEGPGALTMTAHLGIALCAAVAGDVARHRRHLALTLADLEAAGGAIGDPDWIWGACHLAESEGRAKAALRLAGAAHALEQRGGIRSPEPIVSGLCRDAVRSATAKVGKRAAARYAAQGAEMTMPELMAEALAEPGPLDRAMSSREQEVAELVGRGLGNDEIASRLHLSRRTVETHVENCRTKLDLATRFELAVWAVERRLMREAGSG
jgi:predicted ATPase/DNA-binding CsgD family transcriptional regulator